MQKFIYFVKMLSFFVLFVLFFLQKYFLFRENYFKFFHVSLFESSFCDHCRFWITFAKQKLRALFFTTLVIQKIVLYLFINDSLRSCLCVLSVQYRTWSEQHVLLERCRPPPSPPHPAIWCCEVYAGYANCTVWFLPLRNLFQSL